MTLAKAVLKGIVYKSPEKRFTTNNVAITSFVIDINPEDETLVRVIAKGGLAERVVESVQKGDTVIVDGRLQNETVKTETGQEKKVVQVDANFVEKLGSGSMTSSVKSEKKETLVEFADEEYSDDLIGEDEIPF